MGTVVAAFILIFVGMIFAAFLCKRTPGTSAPVVTFLFGGKLGKEKYMADLSLTADAVDALTEGRKATIDPSASTWALVDDGAGAVLTMDPSQASGSFTLPVDASGSAVTTTGLLTGNLDVDLGAGVVTLTVTGSYAVVTQGTAASLVFGTPH